MALSETEQKYLIDFGMKLRKIRETKGWTLEKAEEKGWPSWQHLQKIELGQKNINLVTLRRLEKLYRTKLIKI